jgi:cystinosin
MSILDDAFEESPAAETPLLGEHDRQEQGEERIRVHGVRPTRWRRFCTLILAPLTDESGSGWGVVVGLATLGVVGTTLGILLPQNPNLPSPIYRAVSSAIGYIYFSCWSVSFYPQVVSNYTRKSTQGLSTDFCGLNVIGFGCYSIYNLCFFCSKVIQDMYKERHGGSEITVQSNDVAFAVHAFILSLITLVQIGYYNGIRAVLPSRVIAGVMIGILTALLTYLTIVAIWKKSTWLDFLYFLSYIKIFVSLIKYLPQVILNMKRKSTVGWSIWNILLDFTGGILSVLQLVLDCASMGDWTGITGNVAKFVLGNVSIFFDVIFMLQHYVLYHENSRQQSVSSTSEHEDESHDVRCEINEEENNETV